MIFELVQMHKTLILAQHNPLADIKIEIFSHALQGEKTLKTRYGLSLSHTPCHGRVKAEVLSENGLRPPFLTINVRRGRKTSKNAKR